MTKDEDKRCLVGYTKFVVRVCPISVDHESFGKRTQQQKRRKINVACFNAKFIVFV